MVLSYRCILIRIRTWIFNDYLNWNFILRTIWVSDNNCCVFVTFSCSINRCLVLEGSAFWKVTNVANWIFGIWLITWFNCLILSYRGILIGVGTWIFNCYLDWDFVLRAIWVSHNDCCSFIAWCCCIHWSLKFKFSSFWKITNIADWILCFWCFTNIDRLVFRRWCVLIRISTWVYNLNWYRNFILRAIWISHNDCCSFIARCCCIHWSLEFELSSFWKVSNIADWILCFWCFTNVNRLILRCWCVLICICTRIYNLDSDWHFVLRSIWKSHNDSCSFISRSCCIQWSLKFKFSSFWKITNIANWFLRIWSFTNIDCLILRRWRVLIRISTWVYNLNWYRHFIDWTIWVSHNDGCSFITRSCCIHWSLELKLSSFWKISDIADWTFSVWCFAKIDCLILSCWRVLIRICAWVFNSYLNWDFIFRTIWISHNNCCIFVAFCCCVNWCLVLELSAFWKITDITNWILSVWLIAWFNRLIFGYRCILIGICTRIHNLNCDWHFIDWTVWISDNYCCTLITRSCCIHWSLKFKFSSFWKITNIPNWVLSVWCFADVNSLILSCWRVLICIRTWIYDCYLNWDFILRAIWVCHNDGCVLLTWCCCIYWCLVLKCCATW